MIVFINYAYLNFQLLNHTIGKQKLLRNMIVIELCQEVDFRFQHFDSRLTFIVPQYLCVGAEMCNNLQ